MLRSKKKRQIKKWATMCTEFELILFGLLSDKHAYYASKVLERRKDNAVIR